MGSGSGGGGGGGSKIEESPLERELSKIAQEQYSDFKEIYMPLEDKHIERVRGYNTDEQVQQMVNPAMAGVTAQAGQLSRGDYGPELGHTQDSTAMLANNLISAKEGAKFDAGSRYLGGMKELTEMGRGIQSGARADLATSASRQINNRTDEIASQLDADRRNSEGLGNLIGGGLSAIINKGWLKKL